MGCLTCRSSIIIYHNICNIILFTRQKFDFSKKSNLFVSISISLSNVNFVLHTSLGDGGWEIFLSPQFRRESRWTDTGFCCKLLFIFCHFEVSNKLKLSRKQNIQCVIVYTFDGPSRQFLPIPSSILPGPSGSVWPPL